MGQNNAEAPVEVPDAPVNEDLVGSEHDVADMLDELGRGDDFRSEEPAEIPAETPEETAEEEATPPVDGDTPPVEEELETPETPETPEVPEVSELDAMRQQLSNLSAVLVQHGIDPSQLVPAQPAAEVPVTPVETPVVPQPETPAPQQATQKIELTPLELSQEEFDAVFEKPENLVGLLNKVRESAVEQVLRSVPTLAANIVNEQAVLKGMVQDFYATNTDLAGVKPFVAVVANEVSAKNPGWSVEQVFQEAAVETRKRLNIKKQAEAPATPAPRKPGLPGKKTGGRLPATPKLSKLEKELSDLM